MSKPVKLTIWGVVFGLLPFLVFVGATSAQTTNGELTAYSYLNLAAVLGGVLAAGLGLALLRRGPSAMSEYRPPRWAVPVCVLLVLLGAFQVVRGVGLLPDITGCVSETGTMGFCAEQPASDPFTPILVP